MGDRSRESRSPHSLRTVRVDLPHTALRSVVLPQRELTGLSCWASGASRIQQTAARIQEPVASEHHGTEHGLGWHLVRRDAPHRRVPIHSRDRRRSAGSNGRRVNLISQTSNLSTLASCCVISAKERHPVKTEEGSSGSLESSLSLDFRFRVNDKARSEKDRCPDCAALLVLTLSNRKPQCSL